MNGLNATELYALKMVHLMLYKFHFNFIKAVEFADELDIEEQRTG